MRNQYYIEFLKTGNWTQSNNKDEIINIVLASQKLTTATVTNCWKKSTLLSSHFDFKILILEENFKHGTLDWKFLRKDEDKKESEKEKINTFIRTELGISTKNEDCLLEEEINIHTNNLDEGL